MASSALARAELEALLRARKLDRTVTRGEVSTQGGLATGIAVLDEALGGGVPRGEMSEATGPRSSGRTSVVCAALAATTRRGEFTALVDTVDMFDPASAAQAGVVFDRLLWIRGDAISRHAAAPATGDRQGDTCRRMGQPASRPRDAVFGHRADPWARALDRAVKAVNLVLQAGGFDLVVLDLAEVPPEAIRRLPFTTWFRLQRTIEGSRTACLLAAPVPVARSAGGVTLELSRPAAEPGRWSGQPGHVRLFLGLDIEAHIVRSREGATDTCRFSVST